MMERNKQKTKICHQMNKLYFKVLAFASFLSTPTLLLAQDAAPAAEATSVASPEASSIFSNPVALVMMLILLVLLFVIIFLARVASTALDFYRKSRAEERRKFQLHKGTITVLTLMLTILGSTVAFAQDAAATAEVVAEPVKLIGGMKPSLFYFLFFIFLLECLTIIALVSVIRYLMGIEKRKDPSALKEKKVSRWLKFNKTKSLDASSEAEANLGHNYDGIEELDNPTPPWWQIGFWFSVVVGVIYLWRYEVAHTAPNQYEEFAIEVKKGEEAKAAFLASSANNVDETNVTLLTDASAVDAGKQLFIAACAACHANDGGGTVGPNLTDDYWKHGGDIASIFKTIKYGVPEKGMKSWKDDYSPVQIQQLSSFIMSLHGTKPGAPKAPEGDLYTPSAAPAAAADSAATNTADSTQAQSVDSASATSSDTTK